MQHIPVLAKEVLDALSLRSGECVVDATLGLGGHARLLLDATSPQGTLVGFDRDLRNLDAAKANLAAYGDRVTFVHDSFGNMGAYKLRADAVIFDLGFSSVHVDDASRGFSFMKTGSLDMRYDVRQELTAETVVNDWPVDELAAVLRKLGEEPNARKIAGAIVEARRVKRITSTTELADVVSSVVSRHGKTHPATRTFQAIRMAVNDELGEIAKGIGAAIDALPPGGRLAIITFHSLEDRLVKNLLRDESRMAVVTKKPVVPSDEEIHANPRSRSAKLRVAVKT